MTSKFPAAASGGRTSRKRNRSVEESSFTNRCSASASSTYAVIENCLPNGTLEDAKHRRTVRRRRSASSKSLSDNVASLTAERGGFNDLATADVILRLFVTPGPFQEGLGLETEKSDDVQVYLHSNVLVRSKYFSALLSDRWMAEEREEVSEELEKKTSKLNYGVTVTTGSFDVYLTVLKMLYSCDLVNAVGSVATALAILPVALELLFEDCVKACVRFLEAVPWTEEEEKRVLGLIPLLNEEESSELMARLTPQDDKAREEMLQGIIMSALYNYPNIAFVKAFVAKLLKEFLRESVKRALEIVFGECLKLVRESLEQYSSPEFRVGNNNETEATQRLNLHTAMTSAKHLFWVIDRMVDMKVADFAVKVWSEQESLSAELLRVFRDDASRQMVPGFATITLRCISRLATAVATGSIVASRSVRMKLVKEWLPVLNACKDITSYMMPAHKTIAVELEETFLRIISTLPMSDSQEMLKQCLCFSTRNVDDCPHLVSAFNTWFSRAARTAT